jgi:hypothetical protein
MTLAQAALARPTHREQPGFKIALLERWKVLLTRRLPLQELAGYHQFLNFGRAFIDS